MRGLVVLPQFVERRLLEVRLLEMLRLELRVLAVELATLVLVAAQRVNRVVGLVVKQESPVLVPGALMAIQVAVLMVQPGFLVAVHARLIPATVLVSRTVAPRIGG